MHKLKLFIICALMACGLISSGLGQDQPMLIINPGNLSHTIMSGQSLTNVDVVAVANVGVTHDMGFEVTESIPWLSFNAYSGVIPTNGTTNLSVSYNATTLTAGSSVTTYTGYVTFTATNMTDGTPAISSPQVLEVNVTVNPRPQVRVNKVELNNSVMQGYDAVTQRFDVWNGTGFYPLNFTISNNVSWLKTSITSGTSTGQRYTVEVLYSTTGLKSGIYNAKITVSGWDPTLGLEAVDSPRVIDVIMEVKPVAVLGIDGVTGMTNSIRKGATAAPGEFKIWNACIAPQSVLSYEIFSDVQWLSFDPESKTNVPGIADTITMSYHSAGLAPGYHYATITINARDVGTDISAINSPRLIPVELFIEETKPLDFLGDGIAEMVVYHEKSGMWHILNMHGFNWSERFGGPTYTPAPGDYDGDGTSELGVYRASSGAWYSKPVNSYTILEVGRFGGEEYIPVRGDFDGDGRQDFALYAENSGRWYIMSPDGNIILWDYKWGGPGYKPLTGDFSGNGANDLAVYDENTGSWYVITTEGILVTWEYSWGAPGFVPIVGDYDGDGLADLAVYHPGYGWWFVNSLTQGIILWAHPWGGAEGIPLAGDYNGDGITDLAVYRDGFWFISGVDGTVIVNGLEWGGYGYVPIGM